MRERKDDEKEVQTFSELNFLAFLELEPKHQTP